MESNLSFSITLNKASQVAQWSRICLPIQGIQETWVWSSGAESPLEEEIATHFSILARKIPWTEEITGLHSPWCHRFIHDRATEHITLTLDWDASFNIPSLATKGSAPNYNMCVWIFSLQQEILQHQHGLLQFNSVLTWYTWRWHQIPQDKSLVLQDWGCPSGTVVKNLPANAGDSEDVGLIPGLGRSSGGGNGNPLQYSYWENPIHRGLQSMGCKEVSWSHLSIHVCTYLQDCSLYLRYQSQVQVVTCASHQQVLG